MSTQYRFTFRYKDGSFYSGTVVDDGRYGYAVGETFATPFGAYTVDAKVATGVALLAGQMSISLYHDAATGADFVPLLYSQGEARGNGFGTEYDSIMPSRGTSVFGQGGQYQATAYGTPGGTLTLYDFVFSYRDGSSYTGTVFDNGDRGYFDGQTIYTTYGSYALSVHTGAADPGLFRNSGAVRTTSYYDASTGSTYTTANARSSGGGNGLGSENDTVTPRGGSAVLFGSGGRYAAVLSGETQFAFYFIYRDGTTYTGTVVDNGTYGYAVGQNIPALLGRYVIATATPIAGYYRQPIGTVFISYYSSADFGGGPPLYGFQGIASGAAGLGSEHDFVGDSLGHLQAFGGGTEEARSYAHTQYSFRFAYRDGSSYIGSVVDDGSYGYAYGKTIATANGTYTFYYFSAASEAPIGTVKISSYSDASTGTTYTPYLFSLGQAAGTAGVGSEYDFTKGANGYQAFGQGGTFEARQSGSTLYDFVFRYTDGSYYYGEVADNGNFHTSVGQHIVGANGTYDVYGKSGTTALAAGTVVANSYHDITTGITYTPFLAGQGKSDGTAGLGSERDFTDGPAGHLAFGAAGALEARQGGNSLYRFSFTYRDGSAYDGTVADDGSYGYAAGQVIATAYGSYRIGALLGFSPQAAGTVHVSRYDDITTHASYVPGAYAQGKASGDGGLGFEVDTTTGAAGVAVFGDAGLYEARQAPNTMYAFTFTYRDGSFYRGTVTDDGGFGYAAGTTIASPYGRYDIYAPSGYTSQPGGTVSVGLYYDVYSDTNYVPDATSRGLPDGDNGLGFEHDTTTGAAGTLAFGDNGAAEARQAPYTLFSLYFKYTDGSFYYGKVSDPAYTYTAGQTITTSYGFYHIYGASGITADAPGTVRLTSYYDISSRAFFTPFNAASGTVSGTADLGSEIDSTTGDAGTRKFGGGGLYEARQDATTLYDFRFDYLDGSYYLGRVADDGTYGYDVGQTIATYYGAFHITGSEGATSLGAGKVYTTLYYDVYSDLYPDPNNPSPLYTPVRYSLNEIAGYKGLGTEEDFTHAGIYRRFGFGGTAEAKNYYTHEYPLTLPYPPPRTPPGGSTSARLLSFANGSSQSDPAAAGGATTLFSFAFTYADGSRYSGTVADDGSLGYAAGQAIVTARGSYAITAALSATGLASGSVSITSYLDVTTGQVSQPDLFKAGQPAGSTGLGTERDSIGGNHGTQHFGLGGAEEARQGIPSFAFTFIYADGSAYTGTVADDGSLGYAVGQTIVTPNGSYQITGTVRTTGLASGSVSVGGYTDAATGTTYVPDGAPAGIATLALVGAAGLGSEQGTVTGAAGTHSFGQGGALEAKLGIPLFRFQFTYADGSTYRGTVADDGTLGYTAGQSIAGTGGTYTITGPDGVTATASGTVSVAIYRDALTGLSYTPDLGASDGAGGLGQEQDTITVGGTARAFGLGGTLEANGDVVSVYAFTFAYADGSRYSGTVADDGSLGYTVGQTIATVHGTYTIDRRVADSAARAPGSVAVASYSDATTGLVFVPDAGSVAGSGGGSGLGHETGTITGNQGTRSFGQGGAQEASQAAASFDFTFTYTDGSAYLGTVADDGRYGYAAGQVIATAYGSYRIGHAGATTTSAAGTVRVSRYTDAFGGASFVPLLTAAGRDDGSTGLGSEFDMVAGPIGPQAFGKGGHYEATGGAPCYCRGTLIRTADGDVAVEDLAIGDRLVTRDGGSRPIRWIGMRSYAGRFLRGRPALQPVRFLRGSLGAGLPLRDLLVSPDHAMFLDGVLVPASLLVDGRGIVRERAQAQVAYFHVELDSHDVIYAEGAESETFVDDDSRGLFHNAADHAGPAGPTGFYAPRVDSGAALHAIRRRLAAFADQVDAFDMAG